jgi:hypothetical protein
VLHKAISLSNGTNIPVLLVADLRHFHSFLWGNCLIFVISSSATFLEHNYGINQGVLAHKLNTDIIVGCPPLFSKHYAIKTYGEADVSSHAFLTSALDGSEWSASRPGHFTPWEKGPTAPIQ